MHHNIVKCMKWNIVARTLWLSRTAVVVVFVDVVGVDIIKIRRNANQIVLYLWMVERIWFYNADGFLIIISLPVRRCCDCVFSSRLILLLLFAFAAVKNSFNHPFVRSSGHPSIYPSTCISPARLTVALQT